MGEDGIHLYGFARGGTKIPPEASLAAEGPVLSLARGGVAAIFGEVALADYRDDAADCRARNPQWLISRAVAHERVVEVVMQRSPVLPARFGGVFSSRATLTDFLKDKGEEIARFLAYVDGKEEWGVQCRVDAARTEAWLLANDPALAARSAALPPSPGRRYLCEKQLRADAGRQARHWRGDLAETTRRDLERAAVAHRRLECRDEPEAAGRATMVFNAALLLCREAVTPLRELLRRREAEHIKQGLTLRLTGPWPPYNFCPSLGQEPRA